MTDNKHVLIGHKRAKGKCKLTQNVPRRTIRQRLWQRNHHWFLDHWIWSRIWIIGFWSMSGDLIWVATPCFSSHDLLSANSVFISSDGSFNDPMVVQLLFQPERCLVHIVWFVARKFVEFDMSLYSSSLRSLWYSSFFVLWNSSVERIVTNELKLGRCERKIEMSKVAWPNEINLWNAVKSNWTQPKSCWNLLMKRSSKCNEIGRNNMVETVVRSLWNKKRNWMKRDWN